MKAAIFSPTWDSLGGGERYAASFVQFLEKNGFETEIWWPQDLRQKIIDRFNIDLKSTTFVDYNPLKHDTFSRINKTREYDLIFWVSDGSIPVSLAKKTIIHFQIPFHGHACGSVINKLKARMYVCVCNSFFTKSVVDKTYSINSQVIYPPVSTENIIVGKKQNQILSLARFSTNLHAKRQDILIDAFLKLGLKNWKFVLAGGSTDQEYLKQLQSLSSGYPIEIYPNPTLSQIHSLLSQSKIFWSATGFEVDAGHPEFMEHFGITTVEAMAAGCVPLVTNCGGHLETVIDGKTGYLWNTVDELVNKTLELVQDKKKLDTFSKEAIKRSSIFSKERFYRDVATILQASFPSGK